MFSNTESLGKMLVIWKLRDRPMRLIRYGGRAGIGVPFSSMLPLETARRAETRLNRVDLPAPLGPMRACRSPAGTSRSTPRMISVLPHDLHTPVNLSAGAPAAPLKAAAPALRSPGSPPAPD